MSKFKSSLQQTPSEANNKKIDLLEEEVRDGQQQIIDSLQKEKRELNRKLNVYTDVSQDSEQHKKLKNPNYNLNTWLQEIHQLKLQIANKEAEIKIAQQTFDEWFGE